MLHSVEIYQYIYIYNIYIYKLFLSRENLKKNKHYNQGGSDFTNADYPQYVKKTNTFYIEM